MSIRKTAFLSGEYYHVYNRGNSKQVIFHDAEDYIRFQQLLFIANGTNRFNFYNANKHTRSDISSFDRGSTIVTIGAYCLMPNHFHILLTQPENGSIAKFMQKLATGYAMYYNSKYKRTGSLFEGKFKAIHLSNDRYLKYIFSYIHLNPVKRIDPTWKEEGIKDVAETLRYLDAYPYSSYKDYLLKRESNLKILGTDSFPSYFPDEKSFQKEILSWIRFSEVL